MSSTTALLNKSLRRNLSPVLRDAGWDVADARNAFYRTPVLIGVLKLRSIGARISGASGFPSPSLVVEAGMYFHECIQGKIRTNKRGDLEPQEYECQRRLQLEGDYRNEKQKSLGNEAEQKRRDIWWIEPDGSNLEEVVKDIVVQIQRQGLPWLQQCSTYEKALMTVLGDFDCPNTNALALQLAEKCGDEKLRGLYSSRVQKDQAEFKKLEAILNSRSRRR